MTKQTNKQTKTKGNNGSMCKGMWQAAASRLDYLQSLLSGERGFSGSKRMRSYRVESTLSIRDAFRLEAFLVDIVDNNTISNKTYNRLIREIPEFTQIVSPKLVNMIKGQ